MAGPANPPGQPKGGFNKLFVMLPVMLAARKLDAEDPQTVQYLRMAYGSMQSLCVLVVLYTFMKASSIDDKKASNIVYIPAPPTPFADPEAKKKYTSSEYRAHVLSTARSLVGSTLFGICMTVGLHIYKGMAMGLAIQTIMGPFNLFENPLVKAILMGNGFRPEDKIFEEKDLQELTESDEVVDETGNVIPKHQLLASSKTQKAKKSQSPEDAFEELLLDTWDAGNGADVSKFVSAVTKKNCNQRSKGNEWTPLMILSGLTNKEDTASAIRKVIGMGGNPGVTDKDGWNCLHWAAFHGSLSAAKALYDYDASLLDVKDNEGKLPLEMAQQEDNKEVAKYLEEVTATAAASKTDGGDEGIRKRK
ncbi:unnamed protein product [Pseudo-nitzschia multistriata]|uniref:Uncharacterized protein n=1 Tax=Pseudo-nitzschia multistriata TaxID=183589 RepID=A0A448ZR54_9STRA|nr:unnamed protein product [Pseudo-nitzschia multistriata]